MNTDKEKAEHDALTPFVFAWLIFVVIALMLLGPRIFFGIAALYAGKWTMEIGCEKVRKIQGETQPSNQRKDS